MDQRAILNGVWLPFVIWAAAVLGVTFVQHQPGVVCVTPVAWLMASWVGIRSVSISRSEKRNSRMIEAGIAGTIFGLLQGILFAVIIPTMGPIAESERQKTTILIVVMICVGAIVSAIVSMLTAALRDRRRN